MTDARGQRSPHSSEEESAPQPDDNDLMLRTRRGSEGAFEMLVERWEGSLLRFFRLINPTTVDPEDCVQETFARLYAYRDRFRPERAPLRSLLFRIARNVQCDALRKARRLGRARTMEAQAWEQLAAPDPVPAEDRIDLNEAIASLPVSWRWVVVLGAIEGLEYREVAAILGIPVGTVKSRMHYAVARLREQLRVDSRS